MRPTVIAVFPIGNLLKIKKKRKNKGGRWL
jgi:hypothetical protein